jgi:hypothetical protein
VKTIATRVSHSPTDPRPASDRSGTRTEAMRGSSANDILLLPDVFPPTAQDKSMNLSCRTPAFHRQRVPTRRHHEQWWMLCNGLGNTRCDLTAPGTRAATFPTPFRVGKRHAAVHRSARCLPPGPLGAISLHLTGCCADDDNFLRQRCAFAP